MVTATVVRRRPHSKRAELEVLTILVPEEPTKRVVAPRAKYCIGQKVDFWPHGAEKDGRPVKQRLIHEEFSAGEIEPKT